MLNTLRNRLLASYVAILLIMLVLIGFILLVFLATRPLPTDPVINDLTATLLDVRVVESIQININSALTDQNQPGQDMVRPLLNQVLQRQVTAFLTDAAQTRDVRAMLVANDGYVYFDSAGTLREGTHITETERSALLPSNRIQVVNLVKGRFVDPDGQEWLYVAPAGAPPGTDAPRSSLLVMVAAPVPRTSLRASV